MIGARARREIDQAVSVVSCECICNIICVLFGDSLLSSATVLAAIVQPRVNLAELIWIFVVLIL